MSVDRPPTPDNPPDATQRRSRLLGIKLRALVAEHLGATVDGVVIPYPNGAGLLVGDVAWVLIDGPAGRSLGGALALAIRNGATSLQLIAEADTGLLARRVERFAFPVVVWFAQERTLLPAVAEPLTPPPVALPEHLALIDVIEAAGATTNVEHGVVAGEVRGLEVCRVVDSPTVGHFAELGDVDMQPAPGSPTDGSGFGGVLLEVGVGANDREAFRMLHGDIPTVDALGAVVDSVSAHRSTDAPQHPLNRLGQERFVRWQLEQDPGAIGLSSLTPTDPPVARPNLKDPVPCVAAAVDGDGTSVTVVCSVGIDPDLVGFVADVQLTSDNPVVVVLRERDAVAITRDLLGLLAVPVEIRTV